jgi:hypothetical protein
MFKVLAISLLHLIIFHWLPDIANFTLLRIVYFSIPMSILEIYSRTHLCYWETIWTFWSLLWNLATRDQHSLLSRPILPCYLGSDILSIHPDTTWVIGLLYSSQWGSRLLPAFCDAYGLFPLTLLCGSFPSLTHIHWSVLCSTWSIPSLHLSLSLFSSICVCVHVYVCVCVCVCMFLFLLTLPCKLCLLWPPSYQLCLYLGKQLGSSRGPSPCVTALLMVSLGNCMATFVCSPSLRSHPCALHKDVQHPKTTFHIFYLAF